MCANQWNDPAWAWARYEPADDWPWNLRQAAHLFRRAAFGANWADLQQALADGPQATIDRLLEPQGDVAGFDNRFDTYEAAASRSTSAESLRAWWLRRMIETPDPLREKLTLFWHGHFAISNLRVENAELMYSYLRLLRRHALGRFDQLFEAVVGHPAVLVGLGGAANRRAQPSEFFARAVLEAFGLGEGQCEETDIREAARAFTGQFVLHGEYQFVAREHDPGTKRIFGQEGNWKGPDVVRIVLEQPAVARRIVARLAGWLISETEPLSDALLEPLAVSFAKDYDLRRLVETMLRSNRFFSPQAYRKRIKSPVEYALGIVKGLEGVVPTAPLGGHLAALGQDLCHPPTVAGWEGGRSWLNIATLINRTNLAQAMLSGAEPYGKTLNPEALAARQGCRDPQSAGFRLLDLFVQGDVPEEIVKSLNEVAAAGGDPAERLRELAYAIASLPESQLA